MSERVNDTTGLSKPAGDPSRVGATQVTALITAASAMLDEEFKRSERLDAKSRNIVTVTGAFFAVVQAGVIGLLNDALNSPEDVRSDFVVWLAILGIAAGLQLVRGIAEAYRVWKLRDDPVIEAKTLRDFLPFAAEDNPAVGVKLVRAYAEVIDGRRANNDKRAEALQDASEMCLVAIALIAAELVLAFVAVAVA